MGDRSADGRTLPLATGSWRGGILIDPPYNARYACTLYGVAYPRPSHLLREAARVAAPGARIAIVHYIMPKPVASTRLVRTLGLSTGFDMPMRAITVYERDGRQLELGGPERRHIAELDTLEIGTAKHRTKSTPLCSTGSPTQGEADKFLRDPRVTLDVEVD